MQLCFGQEGTEMQKGVKGVVSHATLPLPISLSSDCATLSMILSALSDALGRTDTKPVVATLA